MEFVSINSMERVRGKGVRHQSNIGVIVASCGKDNNSRAYIGKDIIDRVPAIYRRFNLYHDEKNIAIEFAEQGLRKVCERDGRFHVFIPFSVGIKVGQAEFRLQENVLYVSRENRL